MEDFLPEYYGDIAQLVEKTKIAENGDYNLSGDRYIISVTPFNTEYEMVELGEILDYEQPTS